MPCLSTVHLKCTASTKPLWDRSPLQRDKSQRPHFNKPLLRQTPIHTVSECFSCCQPRGLSLGKKEFLKRTCQGWRIYGSVPLFTGVCLFELHDSKKTEPYVIIPGSSAAFAHPSQNANTIRWRLEVSSDDALQAERRPEEHIKSACHSFLFYLGASLNCSIKSLRDWRKMHGKI